MKLPLRETLWGCDFFSVKSVTAKGLRDIYVIVFLCLQTRELIVTESTEHPDSAWVCEQTKLFAERTKDREKKPEMIIHDRDVKYTKDFHRTVKEAGMKSNPLPKGSPNLNGRSERVIETIKLECLVQESPRNEPWEKILPAWINTCQGTILRSTMPSPFSNERG